MLLPPAPRALAHDVAGRVLAGGAPNGAAAVVAPLHAHGPAALRRRVLRAVGGALLILALALLGWWTGGSPWVVLAGAVALVGAVPLARDRYAALGHAVVGGHLVGRRGSLDRRRTVLAGHAVIGWNLRSTWFQRRLGLVTLTATTAAGRQHLPVPDLDAGAALALADAVTPGLLAQFSPAAARPAHPTTAR